MSPHESVEKMAEHIRLDLSDPELRLIVEIINKTGDYAPRDEIINRFQGNELTPAVLTFFLPQIWIMKQDECTVPNDVWHSMFHHCFFTNDRKVTNKPRRTVRAYRGATAENRDGLAWSLDADQARYFARSRQAPGSRAQVWATNIPSSRVYAHFMDGWEQEITADVRGLTIVPLENESSLPRVFTWPWNRSKRRLEFY